MVVLESGHHGGSSLNRMDQTLSTANFSGSSGWILNRAQASLETSVQYCMSWIFPRISFQLDMPGTGDILTSGSSHSLHSTRQLPQKWRHGKQPTKTQRPPLGCGWISVGDEEPSDGFCKFGFTNSSWLPQSMIKLSSISDQRCPGFMCT